MDEAFSSLNVKFNANQAHTGRLDGAKLLPNLNTTAYINNQRQCSYDIASLWPLWNKVARNCNTIEQPTLYISVHQIGNDVDSLGKLNTGEKM